MDKYTKSVVKEISSHDNLSDVLHLNESQGIQMKVTGGSKINNLISYASTRFKGDDVEWIIWNGHKDAVTKAISCAEITKRKFEGLHQITRLQYKRFEEYWEPSNDSTDRLKVTREVPAISILLSKLPLDSTDLGYQLMDTNTLLTRRPVAANRTGSIKTDGKQRQPSFKTKKRKESININNSKATKKKHIE